MHELSIAEIGAALRARRFSTVDLTRHFLARIDALDGAINSVIETNPDALRIAAALDRERARGVDRGPLHGVPILIKDNIDTADRMKTTAGSIALLDAPKPKRDAFVVSRLRDAGAVILGKTNLSEWANFRGDRSISGWSSRGGQTRNPHDPARSPSGSSSGSGAAVAAMLCAGAVGTETNGSITSPATACGIVGFKPTVGMVSRSGIIPISHTQDTAGPMTRSVADAALLLAGMLGVDRRDAATRTLAAARSAQAFAEALRPDALRGARLGVLRAMSGSDPRVLAVFDRQLDALRAAGAEVVDQVDIPDNKLLFPDEYTVLLCEFKHDLNCYLKTRHGAVRSLRDMIAFNERHADVVLAHFGQEDAVRAQATRGLRDDKYVKALPRLLKRARVGIDRALKRHRLDALIQPTGGPAWMIDTVSGDVYNWDMSSTTVPAVAGYPHITVPMGFVKHLPVGLSFIGRAWDDARVLGLAFAYEQTTHMLRAPGQANRHARYT
jgi:amidase